MLTARTVGDSAELGPLLDQVGARGVTIFQNRLQDGEPISCWLVDFASLTFWMNVLIGRNGWFNYPLGVLWSLSVEEVFYVEASGSVG